MDQSVLESLNLMTFALMLVSLMLMSLMAVAVTFKHCQPVVIGLTLVYPTVDSWHPPQHKPLLWFRCHALVLHQKQKLEI
eukprot:5634031-Amphidinium_carterae.1